AWVEGHPPFGSTGVGGKGSMAQYGVVEESNVAFTYPVSSGAIQSEQVIVDVVPLNDSQVGIRADAQVIWYPTRPPAETIPVGERSVAVEVSGATRIDSPPTVIALRDLTDPVVLSQLATKIDQMPLQIPGARSCPAAFASSPRLTLIFSGGPGVPAVQVVDDTSGCGEVTFTVEGQQEPPLVDDGLFHLVDTILGISLPNVDTTG
ncbi:MAG TPA: hypothetical protein VED63_13445, partial [Acidimicrobiales bacterium]|nr:hypothetical protein [Acidimicrobiales bacterium]